MTPPGGCANPVKLGFSAWQETQRSVITACTLAKGTAAAGAPPVERDPEGAIATASSTNIVTATAGSHAGARPKCRSTKYCRISTPARLIATSTDQPYLLP